MSKRFHELSQQEQQDIRSLILQYAKTLTEIYLGCVERVIKVLLMVNSGGLITVLAYLYKDSTTEQAKVLFNSSLTWFLRGFILTLVVVFADYITVLIKNYFYSKDINDFFGEKQITFFEIKEFSPSFFLKNSILAICIIIIGASSIFCGGIAINRGYHGFIISHSVQKVAPKKHEDFRSNFKQSIHFANTSIQLTYYQRVESRISDQYRR